METLHLFHAAEGCEFFCLAGADLARSDSTPCLPCVARLLASAHTRVRQSPPEMRAEADAEILQPTVSLAPS